MDVDYLPFSMVYFRHLCLKYIICDKYIYFEHMENIDARFNYVEIFEYYVSLNYI